MNLEKTVGHREHRDKIIRSAHNLGETANGSYAIHRILCDPGGLNCGFKNESPYATVTDASMYTS